MPATITEKYTARTLSKKDDGSWTATRTFQIIGATTETDCETAMQAAGIDIGSVHDQNQYLSIDSISYRKQSIGYFEAVCNYIIPDGTAQKNVNPLLQPPIIHFGTGQITEDTDHDINGNTLINSCGDTFTLPRTIYYKTMSVTRNEPYYDIYSAFNYENAINSDAFTINSLAFSVGTIKCISILPSREFTLTDTYVPVRYDFELFVGPDVVTMTDPYQWRVIDEGDKGWALDADGNTVNGKFVFKDDTETGMIRLDGASLPMKNKDAQGQPLSTPIIYVRTKDGPRQCIPWQDLPQYFQDVTQETTPYAVCLRYQRIRTVAMKNLFV